MASTKKDYSMRSKGTYEAFRIGNLTFKQKKEISEYYNINYTSTPAWIRKGMMPDGTIIRKIVVTNQER